MYDQATNQQKSVDESAPLEVDMDIHDGLITASAEQQDKAQESTSRLQFSRHRPGSRPMMFSRHRPGSRPMMFSRHCPGSRPMMFGRNRDGTTQQVPNPDAGSASAPRVLPANPTPSTAVTRNSAVPNPEDGPTSSTTSTQSRLNIHTEILAVTAEAPATEDAHEVNISNVTPTTPATENATAGSSNVRPERPPPVKSEATAKTEDVAASNSNVGTRALATKNATVESSNVVIDKSTVEKGAPANPNVETEVPASEEVVPNNPSMRPKHSFSRSKVTDESIQYSEEANRKEQNSEEKTADVHNCISRGSEDEGSRDDITSSLTKMVEEKCSLQNNAPRTEERKVEGKSQSSSILCCFGF